MNFVAGKELINRALDRSSLEPPTFAVGTGVRRVMLRTTPEEKAERVAALNHVLKTGTRYEPLATKHRNVK